MPPRGWHPLLWGILYPPLEMDLEFNSVNIVTVLKTSSVLVNMYFLSMLLYVRLICWNLDKPDDPTFYEILGCFCLYRDVCDKFNVTRGKFSQHLHEIEFLCSCQNFEQRVNCTLCFVCKHSACYFRSQFVQRTHTEGLPYIPKILHHSNI